MKKLMSLAAVAAVALPLVAQEAEKAEEPRQQNKTEVRSESTVWPAFFAVCEFPAAPDVTGVRLTIPFSTRQDSVTGFDLGLWGRCTYFEGFQLNLLRNDVKGSAAGFQVGLYNSVGSGELVGLQVGLWNEAFCSMRGVQIGLVNIAGEADGFQIGIVYRTETMSGYQIGLINVIREAEVRFFPILNVGF